jgi:hypothetical protein
MLNLKTFLGIALLWLVCSGTVSAAEEVRFLVTEDGGRGARVLSLDLYSDGTLVGFQVDLRLESAPKASIGLDGCKRVKGVEMNVSCDMLDGIVRISGINLELQPLAKGWHNLGKIRVKGAPHGRVVGTQLQARDADGKRLSVSFDYETLSK